MRDTASRLVKSRAVRKKVKISRSSGSGRLMKHVPVEWLVMWVGSDAAVVVEVEAVLLTLNS